MEKKKKALLGTIATIIIILIIAVGLYWPPAATPVSHTSPSEGLPGEPPQDLLVVPEVPLGTITILLTCFFALIISQIRPRTKTR
jgi:hypothetical protein